MKYWLTFNEVNVTLISPLMGAGIMTPKGAATAQDWYQAAHHQLVASALVTEYAHRLDPTLKIGCMAASAPRYPMTCAPDDVMTMMLSQQELDYFITVHCTGSTLTTHSGSGGRTMSGCISRMQTAQRCSIR